MGKGSPPNAMAAVAPSESAVTASETPLRAPRAAGRGTLPERIVMGCSWDLTP